MGGCVGGFMFMFLGWREADGWIPASFYLVSWMGGLVGVIGGWAVGCSSSFDICAIPPGFRCFFLSFLPSRSSPVTFFPI